MFTLYIYILHFSGAFRKLLRVTFLRIKNTFENGTHAKSSYVLYKKITTCL